MSSAHPFRLVLATDAAVDREAGGGVRLRHGVRTWPLGPLPAGAVDLLATMGRAPVTLEAFLAPWLAAGVSDPMAAYRLLEQLRRKGALCHAMMWRSARFATLAPLRADANIAFAPVDVGGRHRLCPFALIRDGDDGVEVESPLAPARIVLHCWQATALLHALWQGASAEEIARAVDGVDAPAVAGFMTLLAGAGLLALAAKSDAGRALRHWDFYDLMFHGRSRLGQRDRPTGATYRLRDRVPPLPARKSAMSAKPIALETATPGDDLPLRHALDERRSIRTHGEAPITLRQLGGFLYLAARNVSVRDGDAEPYQRVTRPYPSAGGCHELEIYVAVDRCQDLPPGLYHYDPSGHDLHPLMAADDQLRVLLSDASEAAGMASPPQVLLVITARFQRIAWKYETIAYALVLKHVGVMMQTMYLVATAMRLAPCALGAGNTERLAAAIGNDFDVESSVGEFMLGSRPHRK